MQTNIKNIKILFLTGSLLLITIATSLVVTSLSFFAGIGVQPWQFPFSFVLAAALYYYTSKTYYQELSIYFNSLVVSIIIIIAAVYIGISLYDVSYDGQSYHQESILQLKEGWNPFQGLLAKSVNFSIYINHYSRGVELPQSTLYSLTNHIESSKATNFILLIAGFSLTLSYLLSLNRISRFKCILISIFAALNPIAVNQLISTYVDGQLAIMLLCTIVASLMVLKEANLGNLTLLGGTIIIGSNVKFTGLVYEVVFVIALLSWLLYVKQIINFKRVLYTAVVSGIVAVFIVGFSPYVLNTVNYAHPFYPLMGKNKVDIMGMNTPHGFEGKNGLTKFFTSIFAHTDNVMPNNGREVKLKVPFTISKTDIVNASKIDTRIGGFGPLFSGILLLSIASFIIFLMDKANTRAIKNSIYLMLVLIFSVCIIPESWWARYIPQLWYVPLIILISAELYATNKVKILKLLLYITLALNISFALGSLAWNMMMTSLVNYQMQSLKSTHQTIIVQWGSAKANRIRFQEYNIPYVEQNLDRVPNTENIIRSDSKFIIPKDKIKFPKSKFVQLSEKFQQATEK